MKALLKLSGIEKSFGAVSALKGVSFELELRAGEVHALFPDLSVAENIGLRLEKVGEEGF